MPLDLINGTAVTHRGTTGDTLHRVLCAAGYNIRWLLRAIMRLGGGLRAFLRRRFNVSCAGRGARDSAGSDKD